MIEQTWDILEDELKNISYTRELPSETRFEFIRNNEENYAVLYIFTYNVNTYRKNQMRHTRHEFVVPIATYNRRAWVRWVFDRIASIELHETAEWFFVNGERIYAQHHSNGWDPYTFWPSHDYSEKSKALGDE